MGAVGGAIAVGGDSIGAAAGSISVTVVDDTTRAYIEDQDGAPAASAGITSGSTVNVAALSTLDLIGIAGSIAGGKIGVGLGVDTGIITRTTEAYIGKRANVSADDSVIVRALGRERMLSISASVGIAKDVAGTLTVGASVLVASTRAYIGEGASVTAQNNVLVSADGDTLLNQVSGSISAAKTGAAGIATGISVINKTTDAYIAADAEVTALALGDAIVVETGEFGHALVFTKDDVSGSQISIVGHGLKTGDPVLYTAGNPITGVDDKTRYFAIRIDPNTLKLASSETNARNGIFLSLDASGLSSDDRQLLRKID
ncbi:MAG: hypothetical protein IH849_06360 [Acidobacteria bacterium]|nr:hypothetical protein [Acidobacteriota bacterium]